MRFEPFVLAFAAELKLALDSARARRDEAHASGWKGNTDRYQIEAAIYERLLEAVNAAVAYEGKKP
jgi:hypothetical protein